MNLKRKTVHNPRLTNPAKDQAKKDKGKEMGISELEPTDNKVDQTGDALRRKTRTQRSRRRKKKEKRNKRKLERTDILSQ